jgi:hypothetical protein
MKLLRAKRVLNSPIGCFSKPLIILRSQIARRRSNVELKHPLSSFLVGKRDVDSLLEPTSEARVDLPGDVGRSQNEDAVHVIADATHLGEELYRRKRQDAKG